MSEIARAHVLFALPLVKPPITAQKRMLFTGLLSSIQTQLELKCEVATMLAEELGLQSIFENLMHTKNALQQEVYLQILSLLINNRAFKFQVLRYPGLWKMISDLLCGSE